MSEHGEFRGNKNVVGPSLGVWHKWRERKDKEAAGNAEFHGTED